MSSKINTGFTLMELLVAIAIVAVLAGVAIPSYLHYVKQSHYSAVMQTAERYKVAVAACLQKRAGRLTDCDGGHYGIPANITASHGVGDVDAVSVVNGIITITYQHINIYTLTPSYNEGRISWTTSSGSRNHNP